MFVIRKLFVLFSISLLAVILAGCGGSVSGNASGGSGTLRVGLVPNQNPGKVQAEYEPLAKYLSKKVGEKVDLSVPTSYNAVVEAMANDKLDVAYFGGLTYVQARQRAKVTPLVTEINPYTHNTKYHSLIIVPSDSKIKNVSELKGKTFAFGSVSSTSGSLYPSIMLKQAGIDYRNDLGQKIYTGGHDTTAQAVANGKVAAGGLEDRILYELEKQGTIDKSKVRTIKQSAPIEGYPWVVRDSLSSKKKQEITDAFLNMKDLKLLDLLHAEGYAKVKASDYDYIEQQAKKLGLLTAK